jgi:predicted CopG family antitoxin
VYTKYKNIRISDETYQELANQGNLQDSFDSVIKKLIIRQKEKDDLN